MLDALDLYNKFDKLGLNIREAFSVDDSNVLTLLLQKAMKKGIRVAEVGAWKGCSTAVIANSIQPHDGRLYSTDTFQGSEGTWNVPAAAASDILAINRRNQIRLGFGDTVVTIVGRSTAAAEAFADNYFDVIFLDGDHRYVPFVDDLKCWYPKLAEGGIICGHDHSNALAYRQMDQAERALVDANLALDYVEAVGHPGVIKGCHDFFGADFTHVASMFPRTSMWCKKKGGSGPVLDAKDIDELTSLYATRRKWFELENPRHINRPSNISVSSQLEQYTPDCLTKVASNSSWHAARPASFPQYIHVDFDAPVHIEAMFLRHQPTFQDRAPAQVRLLGRSGSDSEWRDLTQTVSVNYTDERSLIVLSQPGDYRQCRLEIHSSVGGGELLTLSKLYLLKTAQVG